jgi:hypothetical protein
MKKHDIAKPSANVHISLVNIDRGTSASCLIVRYIVFSLEITEESPTNQDEQKKNNN